MFLHFKYVPLTEFNVRSFRLPSQVITADGELNAARALKEAAETIAQSSTAMQLRYLQTLNIIAAERGSTIVFPIPIDMMGPMVRLFTLL